MTYKNGFTLIELLVTLILISMLILFSIPSFNDLFFKNEQQKLIDDIKIAVHYAKIQSIIRGYPVYLSPLESESDWSKGMLLSQLNKLTKKPETLHQWQWKHRHWEVVWKGVNSAHKITIAPNSINAISNGTFKLTNRYTQKETRLILNRLGRLRIEKEQMD